MSVSTGGCASTRTPGSVSRSEEGKREGEEAAHDAYRGARGTESWKYLEKSAMRGEGEGGEELGAGAGWSCRTKVDVGVSRIWYSAEPIEPTQFVADREPQAEGAGEEEEEEVVEEGAVEAVEAVSSMTAVQENDWPVVRVFEQRSSLGRI
jgi:hypothetical protein